MRQALYQISGVDLTRIDAMGVETAQVVRVAAALRKAAHRYVTAKRPWGLTTAT